MDPMRIGNLDVGVMLLPIGEPAINGFARVVRFQFPVRRLAQELIMGRFRADREKKIETGNGLLVFLVNDSDRLRTTPVQGNGVFVAQRVALSGRGTRSSRRP